MGDIAASIIIPFYNGASYMDKCLKCATNQFSDYKYEIILINDGSTDDSEQIVRKWIERYSCIKYISIENSGVSNARNIGIDQAQGKYVWFMDADDLMCYGALQYIYEIAEKRELEIAAFGLKKLPITECDSFFDNPEFDPKDRLEFFSEDEISGEEYIKKTNGLIWEFACVVQYLYRRDMLLSSNVRFNKDLSYSEDLYFMWNILPFVTRMSHTGLVPYRYVQNPNSCLNSNEKGHVRKVNDSMFKLALLFHSKRGCFIRDKALSTLLDKTIKDLILRHLVIMLRQGYPIEIVKSRLLELEKQRLFPVGYELIGSPYLPKSKKWRFLLWISNSRWRYLIVLRFYKLLSLCRV